MNLYAWILFIFVAHAALYFFIGTENWLSTTLLATGVWAVGLVLIRFLIRQRQKERT